MNIKVTRKGIGVMKYAYGRKTDYVINAAAKELVESLDMVVKREHDFRTTDGNTTIVYQTTVRIVDETQVEKTVPLYHLQLKRDSGGTAVEIVPIRRGAKQYLKMIRDFYRDADK